jgi:hypothetical protein
MRRDDDKFSPEGLDVVSITLYVHFNETEPPKA